MSQTAARLQPHPLCVAFLRRQDAEAARILEDCPDAAHSLRRTAWAVRKSVRKQLRLLTDTTTH